VDNRTFGAKKHRIFRNLWCVRTTGVARNFDWEGPKLENFCDVILGESPQRLAIFEKLLLK